ncbi:hypothetical protein PAHAL_9G448200 [Panicum hallii]|uniref:Uncharacterized protein n=1 Tax=Panicum hallii TaxID=206008 RepID=A0A2T8I4P3_9POAL|nr:hypothetical protein PAHAL_9G448200 [Panicum hallii]
MDHHRCKFLRRACSEGRSRGFGKRTAQGGRPGQGRQQPQHAFIWAEEAGNQKPIGNALLIYRPRVRSDEPARSTGTAGPSRRTEAAPPVPRLDASEATPGKREEQPPRLPGSLARRWQLVERAPRSCHPLLRINLGLCSSRF